MKTILIFILLSSTCYAQLTQYFDFHLIEEAPEEKLVIALDGKWNAVTDFYQEAVIDCISDRDGCLEREAIYVEEIKYLKNEALKASEVTLPDMILSWEFMGGVVVGVGVTSAIIYGIKKGL